MAIKISATCCLLYILSAFCRQGEADVVSKPETEACVEAEPSESRLTNDELTAFIREHNDYRRNVTPSAANMHVLYWHEELAIDAQKWSEECLYREGRPRKSSNAFSDVGLNLFVISAGNRPNIYNLLEQWNKEEEAYHYVNNTCNENATCAHYLQLVWATTTYFGCAIADCTKSKRAFMPKMHLAVCYYAPAANLRGDKPYIEGTACTACPNKTKCNNGLCAIEEPCKGLTCESGGKVEPHTCGCYYSKSHQGANCEVEVNEDVSKNDTTEASTADRVASLKLLYAIFVVLLVALI